jgi:hypothetical protein
MAQIRIITGLGYGLVTFLFLKNSDGLGDYVSEIGRTTIHFWSRSPKDRSLGNNNGDMEALGGKLDKLASMKRETVHIHHGSSNSTSGWVTTVIGGTVCIVIVAHVSGLFDMSGIMYVTQSKFKTATEALKEGISTLSSALSKVRVELLEKIGLLETSLESTREELKNQIVSSADQVRIDVAKVSGEVRDVGFVVGGLESKLGTIEGGVGELHLALDKANRGIHLLCHVVAESYRYANGSSKDQQLYSDLLSFTKSPPPPSIESGKNVGDLFKQIKENGEGPIMRLVSNKGIGGNADNGGGGTASFVESLNRQMSALGSIS